VLIQNVGRGEFEERIFGNQYDMLVYSKGGKYYVKDSAGKIVYSSTSASGAIQYAIDNAVSLTGYTVDSGRFVVVKGVSMPPGLRLRAPVVHIDEDYAVYTPNGIVLSPDVYRRMVLYIRDRPVNLVNGEVFESRGVLFTDGWIYINRGGYLRSRSKLYTAEMPWRSDAVDIGGWCWINHPNILYVGGYIFLGYLGMYLFDDAGAAVATVARINPSTGYVERYGIRSGVDDDHAVPALDVLPDGRIVATVTKHYGDYIRVGITNDPYGISLWTFRNVDLTGKLVKNTIITYPVPVVLGSRIYVFFRDGASTDAVWRFIYSDDEGNSWSDPVTFLVPPSGATSVYVVLSRVGNKVHMTANLVDSNGNVWNVYYFYFDGSAFYRADGSKIADVGTVFTPEQADKVFDVADAGFDGSWSYDVYVDAGGRPVIAFSAYKKLGGVDGAYFGLTQQWYYVAVWDGSRWVVRQVADNGDLFPILAPNGVSKYAGGIYIMRSDPSKVLVSRKRSGGWGIEVRDLNGSVVSVLREPSGPYEVNMRPIEDGGYVFWMSGSYAYFEAFSTYILTNVKISTVKRRMVTRARDLVLSAWFTVEPDMDNSIRHVINMLGYYFIRLNNLRLELGMYGNGVMKNVSLSVGEHHAMVEVVDSRIYTYLDGDRYLSRFYNLIRYGYADMGRALEIGYREGYTTPEWWGRVRDVVLIYGRVGRATKRALYNARFYNGIVVPEPGVYRGVAVLRAGSTRVAVQHFINELPSRVFITPINQPPGKLWVENISRTSFDIVTDTAPTTDLAIAWQAEI
jgi:hypothetical protein